MKFGLHVTPQFTADQDLSRAIDDMAQQTRAAREAGFESIWVPHHFVVHPMRMFQAHTLLARLSAEAGPMRLGTAILLLSMLNPVQVAEDAATLDWMTEGGYVLAAGLGYRPEEFQALGVPMKQRVGRFEESIGLIRRLWTEERVTHHGRYFTVDDGGLSLPPRRDGGCPLWVGGAAKPALERAARIGDAWIASFTSSIEQLSEQYAVYRAALGDKDVEYPLCRECFVAASDADAVAAARDPILGKYAAYASWNNTNVAGRTLDTWFDELRESGFLIGDDAKVRRGIARLRDELGVTMLIVRMSWPGLDNRLTLASIERFGDLIREFS